MSHLGLDISAQSWGAAGAQCCFNPTPPQPRGSSVSICLTDVAPALLNSASSFSVPPQVMLTC